MTSKKILVKEAFDKIPSVDINVVNKLYEKELLELNKK